MLIWIVLATMRARNVWDINAKILNAKCFFRNHNITSKDVCHLLYGLPGSGKTATVDEICKLIAMRLVFKISEIRLENYSLKSNKSNGSFRTRRIFWAWNYLGNWKFFKSETDVGWGYLPSEAKASKPYIIIGFSRSENPKNHWKLFDSDNFRWWRHRHW